jgi:osmotically inducible protein OsmC
MPVRTAEAVWHGSIGDGHGHMSFGNGAFEGSYSVPSRFEDGEGTNPEELLGAAHAGCFSMALSSALSNAGHPPNSVQTTAQVSIEKTKAGWTVTKIHLITEAEAAGVEREQFLELAETAKQNCPVSRALAGVEISMEASLR